MSIYFTPATNLAKKCLNEGDCRAQPDWVHPHRLPLRRTPQTPREEVPQRLKIITIFFFLVIFMTS